MPELPEVETIRRDLEEQVAGRLVRRVRLLAPKTAPGGLEGLERAMAGRRVVGAGRHGKNLFIQMEGGWRVLAQLRMTGQFLWGGPERLPAHARAVFELEDGDWLVFRDIRRFGRLVPLDEAGFEAFFSSGRVGPDVLEVDAQAFAHRLASRRGRLKPLLLDQSFVAGLGNIYVDETLHLAGLHPLAPAGGLGPDTAARVLKTAQDILWRAIELRGSTTSNYVGLAGRPGGFQRHHRAYGRAGQPCLACGQAIERIVVGGRGTCFCPGCQAHPGGPQACQESP